MKIAWFTPFCKKSAIGRYSKFATVALSKYANVDLFVYEHEELHSTKLRVINYNSETVLSQLVDYDICIYNIGDNSNYHAAIYDVMKQRRGIAILHDVCLHNFFRGYYIAHLQTPDEYVKLMKQMYGSDADIIFAASMTTSSWAEINLLDYHMTELLYPYCLGIAVHSNYHALHLQPHYKGAIKTLPLIYENEWNLGKNNRAFKGYDTEKINLLTVGMINPNKRIHNSIKAIGSDTVLRSKVNLTCIGSLENKEYVDQLYKQIEEMGLEENVKLLGFVEHTELADYYKNADVMLNLRYPAYEGGSASLVEQLQLGKLLIVSDTGVYSEVPDRCVIKIDVKDEVKSLKNALLKIVNNPAIFQKHGEKALAYANQTFTAENYGEKLHSFVEHVEFLSPLNSLMDLLGQELRAIGVSPDMQICRKLSQEVELLYQLNP